MDCCDVLLLLSCLSITSGLTFSLQVLVRRGHCKVCERESLWSVFLLFNFSDNYLQTGCVKNMDILRKLIVEWF